MSAATDLRREAAARGQAGTRQAGWSIVLTRPGIIRAGLGWMLSCKRVDGRTPNPQNFAFIRHFAVEVGAPDREPDQPVDARSPGGATWTWTWEPTEAEMAGLQEGAAERMLRENRPEDLLDGTTWSQGMDPIDPRFAIVTMRFPTEGMPLASYQGADASARMRRFAEGFLAGRSSIRRGRN